jgi:IS30 family transposase
LRRNTCPESGYISDRAQAFHAARRAEARPARKLDMDGVAWVVVKTLLDWKWSPQQIAATLKSVFPNEPERHVSHETIYTAIYAQPRGDLRRQLIACLRHGRSTRLPRSRGTDRRGQIPEMVSIHVRPPEVNDRVMPGHWEGDLIKGAGNKSAVGVLVERTSRLVLLARMQDATAATALAAFTAKLQSIAAPLRSSLTYDQGKEMARHAELRVCEHLTARMLHMFSHDQHHDRTEPEWAHGRTLRGPCCSFGWRRCAEAGHAQRRAARAKRGAQPSRTACL